MCFVSLKDSADEKIPMCVIGNKVDLREQLAEGSCVSSLHGEKLAKVTFPSTWWKSVYTDAWPPRHLNKLTALRYVNTFLTGVRRLVLRNKCQRRNQRRWGCASSSKVGGHRDRKRGLECQVFFLHNPQQHSDCFFHFPQRSKEKCQTEAAVRLSGQTESNKPEEDTEQLLRTESVDTTEQWRTRIDF